MRAFFLDRRRDPSGVSGTGRVAEGVMFSNGRCVLTWLTEHTSVGIYESIEDVRAIHGHSGDTQITIGPRLDASA